MLQILGLRTWTPKGETEPKKFDKFHDKKWQAKDIIDLFKNLDTYLEAIPDDERWNLFYTVSNCGEGKREFKSLSTIAFDCDHPDKAQYEKYLETICKILEVPRGKVGVVDSGNGFHFLIATANKINSKKAHEALRKHYKAIINKLNAELKSAELSGEFDPTVWDTRRILRLPGTVNRKPDRPDTRAELLQIPERITFNLKTLSGVPDVKKEDELNPQILKKYPNTDNEAIRKECAFMSYAEDNADQLAEPEWYAWLSIAGRMEHGRKLVHEISSKYPGYTAGETDQKLEQALNASGPRTCSNINDAWVDSRCSECPHFGKLTSPITIVGPDHIKTENTGFHTVIINGNGGVTYKPNYQDLRLRFEKDTNYKGFGGTKEAMVYEDGYYKPISYPELEQYAQDRFNPYAKQTMRNEFRGLVLATNIKPLEWWTKPTAKKINFKNGYLDIHTMKFAPHTPEVGFRYVLPYEYNPHAECPNFKKMLKAVTCDDRALMNVLLEFMGYCLSNDDPWAQKALVLVGDGANGKSTFTDVIKALAGPENYGNATMQDLEKSEYSRQLLDGKLFNIAEETPNKALLDNSMFKTMVTGGEMQVRSIYKNPYYIKNIAKLIFICNELPEVNDTSFGYYRRLIIAPFNAKFTKENKDFDPHIKDKLMGELPGIFNLAMSGYKSLVKNQGFTQSDLVDKTITEYMQATDSVLAWYKENVYVNGDAEKFASISDLYDNYCHKTRSEQGRPVTKNKFGRELRRLMGDYDERYCRRLGENDLQVRGLSGVQYGDEIGLDSTDIPEHGKLLSFKPPPLH